MFVSRLRGGSAEGLPREMRPRLFAAADRPFAGVLIGFLAVELTGAAALAQRRVAPTSWDDLPEVLSVAPAPWVADRIAHAKPPPAPPASTPHPSTGPASPASAPAAHDLRDTVRRQGALAVIAAHTEEVTRLLEGAIGSDSIAHQLDQALRDSGGKVELGSGSALPLGPKDTGPVIADSVSVGTEGGALQEGPERAPAAPPPAARIRVEPTPTPGPDSSRVAAYVRSHLAELTQCYEHELKRHPDLAGRLTLRFVVGTDGRITEPDIDEDHLGSDALDACLTSHAGRWHLPFRPADEIPVAFPLVFAPSGG